MLNSQNCACPSSCTGRDPPLGHQFHHIPVWCNRCPKWCTVMSFWQEYNDIASSDCTIDRNDSWWQLAVEHSAHENPANRVTRSRMIRGSLLRRNEATAENSIGTRHLDGEGLSWLRTDAFTTLTIMSLNKRYPWESLHSACWVYAELLHNILEGDSVHSRSSDLGASLHTHIFNGQLTYTVQLYNCTTCSTGIRRLYKWLIMVGLII